MTDIVDRLRFLSAMIQNSERLVWGSDSAAMDEAATEIERLRAERRDRALSELAAHTQAEEAYEARLAAEAEIERLRARVAELERDLEKSRFAAIGRKTSAEMRRDRAEAHAEAAEAEIEGLKEAMQVMASRADDEIERLRAKVKQAGE